MIRAYNFESTTYRIFFKSKNKSFDIEEAYNFNMRMEIPS